MPGEYSKLEATIVTSTSTRTCISVIENGSPFFFSLSIAGVPQYYPDSDARTGPAGLQNLIRYSIPFLQSSCNPNPETWKGGRRRRRRNCDLPFPLPLRFSISRIRTWLSFSPAFFKKSRLGHDSSKLMGHDCMIDDHRHRLLDHFISLKKKKKSWPRRANGLLQKNIH